jgi:hypothetical protein
METLALTQRIGGDWSEIDPVTIDDKTLDVYRSFTHNGYVDVVVMEGIVHVRSITSDDQEQAFIWQFENFTEDPDVVKLLQELHGA